MCNRLASRGQAAAESVRPDPWAGAFVDHHVAWDCIHGVFPLSTRIPASAGQKIPSEKQVTGESLDASWLSNVSLAVTCTRALSHAYRNACGFWPGVPQAVKNGGDKPAKM